MNCISSVLNHKCVRKIISALVFISAPLFAQNITISEFASGFTVPVEIVNAGDARLFVVELGGAVKIVNPDGSINPENFLTLTSSTILFEGERGLFGLVFHPDYADNGYFYVNYTRALDGATAIARYSVDASNPNIANPDSEMVVLTVPQPYDFHKGGTLRFGPDGYLYIGMGDGGGIGDPDNRAQNLNDNLGKMLRIDVNTTDKTPYAIPPDNPYVNIDGNDEIWAAGLRNPWKFCFSSPENELWIADVGQGEFEEINRASVGAPGLNYGWKCYEANSTYTVDCADETIIYTFPFAQYSHTEDGGGCSITGGYIYKGLLYPAFLNNYFFADFCRNRIGLIQIDTGAVTYSEDFGFSTLFSTFGQDVNGELYIASLGTEKIYKISNTTFATNGFKEIGFAISPNPATSQVMIQLTNASLPAEIKIFDITGKLLINENLNSNTSTVSTYSLQSGMYVVKIQDHSGAVSSSKLSIK